MWTPITLAYNWIHHAAQILDNHVEFDAPIVQLCFQALLEAMSAHQTSAGSLLEGIIHFLKVTASYWSGLFHCYSVPGLPRTNNDLEHIFGTVRLHQRRCTGRFRCKRLTCVTRQRPVSCLCYYSNQNLAR